MPTGEVVVITGAASGIGRGLAQVGDARGAELILADIDEDGLHQTAASLTSTPYLVKADVSDPVQVAALADAVFQRHDHVDLLFNNAGVLRAGLSWEIAADRWMEVLQVNIMGIVHCLHHFVPRMILADRACRIINTASAGGFISSPYISPYTATKSAVVALTEALAAELQLEKTKVSVSLLAPGAVRSQIYSNPQTKNFSSQVQQGVAAMGEFTDNSGSDAESFARWVFEEIDAGHFWLVGQPDFFLPLIAARTQRVIDGVTPRPAHYFGRLADQSSDGVVERS